MQPDSTRKILVILEREEVGSFAQVLLPMNRHGRLPALLADPVDTSGTVVPGHWIARNDKPLEAIYDRIVPRKRVPEPVEEEEDAVPAAQPTKDDI